MTTALGRKAVSDLTRRPFRSFLTVLTIAVAVAGFGIFAIPGTIDGAMTERVARHRIFDAWVLTTDVALDGPQLQSLRDLPNIRDLEARTVFRTRVWVGERRAEALVVGVPDFADQPVDAVELVAGRVPTGAEALVDPAAIRAGRWPAGLRTPARVITGSGAELELPLVGQGETLEYTMEGEARQAVVLYAPERTAQQLAGVRGPNAFAVHFDDAREAPARTTMDALHARLDSIVGANSFLGLPLIRPAGTWPGQQDVDRYNSFLVIVAVVALLSSLFLIANTMNTLVSEQRREIGIMKAIGGRRRTIYRSYLRSAAMFGLAGGVAGAVLAVATANVLARFLGGLFGLRPAFTAPPALVGAAIGGGLVVAVLAAVPALVRANRVNVREALTDEVTASYGHSRIDGILRRARLTPMATIGLRSITRRPGRTASTAVQVALAVAVMISFLALSHEAVSLTTGVWEQISEDITVRADTTAKPLDDAAVRRLAELPGVAKVDTMFFTNFEIAGERLEAWGLPPDATAYRPNVTDGRWLRPSDERMARNVAVVGASIARTGHLAVGDTTTIGTPSGPVDFAVVGIDDSLMNNGRSVFVPLAAMRDIIGSPRASNAYWITAIDRRDAAVDRLATRIEEELVASGHSVSLALTHVQRAENIAANRTITSSITVFGLLIVAISMIGLVNAITMNVIDRTREIGVLRCIGARAADLRRAFRIEGLAVTLLGWTLGAPLGFAGARLLTQLVFSLFEFRFDFHFQVSTLWVALAGAIGVSLLVMILPTRRATRLRPGDALRYQ